MIKSVKTSEEKTLLLETIISYGLDSVIPLKIKTVASNEPPSITFKFKELIKERQIALRSGGVEDFKLLREKGKQYKLSTMKRKFNTYKNVSHRLGGKKRKKLSGMTSLKILGVKVSDH